MDRIFIIVQTVLASLLFFLYAKTTEKRGLAKPALINDIVNMDINKIDLPLVNNGRTGNFANAFYPNGANLHFLFDGGFAVSGYVNNALRVSWMATDAFAREWQPGKWGMSPEDSSARFYVVDQSDGFGSQAYINWADAVTLGAGFQDLDGNGFYDPFVDKPDILGDRTIWTVFNDGTPDSVRQIGFRTLPMGLEIQQTVWAFAQSGPLANVIFFRYRLINVGTNDVDSLIFSLVTDSDIGDAADDLTGCNPEFQLGYNYNDGDDFDYGLNPPAFGLQILQGAIVDSPGDTAFHYRGSFFGTDTLPDKKNLLMTSYLPYEKNPTPPFSIPVDSLQARFAQIGGLDKFGNPIDPATWGIGGTASDDPKFAFSGDPVTGSGWLDNPARDRRQLISSGPFQLAAGDTQDIICAYVLGQGNNALESITVMRQNARAALAHIGVPVIVGIHENDPPVSSQFKLYQNYPNPFNPSTSVAYSLSKPANVTLKIYNLLGQKVKTLIDERKTAGIHTVRWDGRDAAGESVSTGIYLYSLQIGSFFEVKKMLLMQ